MHNKPQKPSLWFWISLAVGVLAISQCTMESNRTKERDKEKLEAWQNSPEYAFRFCITTVAGAQGTASPEQIEACRKSTKDVK